MTGCCLPIFEHKQENSLSEQIGKNIQQKEKNMKDETISTMSAGTTATPMPKQAKVYPTQRGYATSYGKKMWLKHKGISGDQAKRISESLVADPDTSKPLYFWQLFSILGESKIERLVRRFYESVYADDEEPWFKKSFTKISGVEHHIITQLQFWCDCFGGGPYYHGGETRLNFHHQYNAPEVMNAKGAQRWMYHMNKAIEQVDFGTTDPRVKPCICDFLEVMMEAYGKTFRFETKGLTYGK